MKKLLRNLIDQAPNIIREAARSPLGVASLMTISLSILAAILFRDTAEITRVIIFIVLILGFLAFLTALLKESAKSLDVPPKEAPEDDEHAFPVSGQYYLVVSKISDRCLDVYGGENKDGTVVHQWRCHQGDNQLWKFVPVGGGYFEIISKDSGKCLSISGSSKNKGAILIIDSAEEAYSQHWELIPSSEGFFQIRSRNSGQCVDVGGDNKEDRAQFVEFNFSIQLCKDVIGTGLNR